jgi:Holliday junction resolvase-like predicted endonuclease
LSSAAKRKGNAAEVAVVKWLQSHGFDAQRNRAGWTNDRGDVDAINGVVIEVKNRAQHNWAAYFEQLGRQMQEKQAYTGVVICKRAGHANPGKWLAVMPADLWLQLIQLLEETNDGI